MTEKRTLKNKKARLLKKKQSLESQLQRVEDDIKTINNELLFRKQNPKYDWTNPMAIVSIPNDGNLR